MQFINKLVGGIHMRKKNFVFLGILGTMLFALTACGAKEDSKQTTENVTSESTTLENTNEVDTAMGESNEEETTENVTTENVTTENVTTENVTTEVTTKELDTEEKSTETITTSTESTQSTSSTDITADYKEMEDYAKSLGCDYTYVKSIAEYKKYAEAHEGKKFAIICKEDLFYFKEDNFYALSTYDMLEDVWQEGRKNDSYKCYVFEWKLDEYVSGVKKDYNLSKTYIIKSEEDIDTAIADLLKVESMDKQIYIAFIYREDIINMYDSVTSKMVNTDFDDCYYVPGFTTGTSTGNGTYCFYSYIYYMDWQPKPVVPAEVVEAVDEYKTVARDILKYKSVDIVYMTTAEEYIAYAESHVGQEYAIIYPKGTIEIPIEAGGFVFPQLSIDAYVDESFNTCSEYYVGRILQCVTWN